MVSTTVEPPVSGMRLSSVVPAEVTGNDKDRELTNTDLALKLHYVRGVYFFSNEAVQGLTTHDLKEPMFSLLALYPTCSGRIRKSKESGRPFIKCNDGGVRIVEARCGKTLDEWLATSDGNSLDDLLVYDQVLGPDLGFSPLVFVQYTWFEGGGLSVGLSWAHVLGDPFSASAFINTWGLIMKGNVPLKFPYVPNLRTSDRPFSTSRKPFSLKRIDPVGDHWLTPNGCKLETRSFHFTAKQLDSILSNNGGLNHPIKISHFEVLSAIIWKSLSKLGQDSGTRIVTVCTRNSHVSADHAVPGNDMVFSIVQADFSVAKGDVYELAGLIAEKQEEENGLIEETVENDKGEFDYMTYGANLTFVNLEEANIYGLELKGQKPVFASYSIKGVGDGGIVSMLPGPETGREEGSRGKTITVTLPGDQFAGLMNELRMDWGLV